ncbi:MAG TPA: diguanylate cyclase [Pirellulales bacterium]|nr:diguanylate cyclase [Pirellulales bacterium]
MLHRKVLIADDDPDIRRLVAYWLEAAGYQVQQAEDGTSALAAAHDDCPHFLICDWDMPGHDGIELCRRIREENFPHYIYTVLLTAHNKVADMILALESGADDLLTKPIASAELLARLRAGARVIELENQLVRLARTDPLTAVPNRWVFFEHFEREFARARRTGNPLSCVLCDIDFFKAVNDTYGHVTGDIILKAFAQVLNSQCRETDHLCRYGGEEFCILLTDTDEKQALQWAQRIRETLHAMALPANGHPLTITVSFGIAELDDSVEKSNELFDRADNALRIAKHTGRDRAVCYSELSEPDGQQDTFQGGYRTWLRGVRAGQIMNAPITWLRHDQPIAEAADLFLRTRINSAPVVDDDHKLVGIVSEKDIVSEPLDWQLPLRDVMKTNVVCYGEETPANVIYDFLCRVSIRRVAIVKDGVPTGVIGRGTFLRLLANWQLAASAVRGEEGEAAVTTTAIVERQLRETVTQLQEKAAKLAEDLVSDCGVTPLFVGAASMQDLALDLVALCGDGLAETVSPALPSPGASWGAIAASPGGTEITPPCAT